MCLPASGVNCTQGVSQVNGRHLNSAFLTSGHSKCFTILANIHPSKHTHTLTAVSTIESTASWSGAGLSEVSLRDTSTLQEEEEPGIKLATFWLLANPLCLLSYMTLVSQIRFGMHPGLQIEINDSITIHTLSTHRSIAMFRHSFKFHLMQSAYTSLYTTAIHRTGCNTTYSL